MIEHILLFKSNKKDEEKKREITKLDELLTSLKGEIKEIIDITTSINELDVERNSDLYYNVKFATFEDMDIYKVHPKHQIVTDFVRENNISLSVIDLRV